jgi:myosin-5
MWWCAGRQIAEGILKLSGIFGYQLGTSKVFLRAGQMAMLDKQRTEKLSKAATVLQRHTRGWIARQHYKQALVLVVRMQVSACMLLTPPWISRFGTFLWDGHWLLVFVVSGVCCLDQLHVRRTGVCKTCAHRSSVAVQAYARGLLARTQTRALRRQKAAVNIQTAWRRYKMRQQYNLVLHNITAVQVGAARRTWEHKAHRVGSYAAAANCLMCSLCKLVRVQ